MARRLVEAGVPFVEVNQGGWDTHTKNFEATKGLCGALDPALSMLITDLHDRGLLDSTLVLWLGEFGRTPKINKDQGRDHYPNAWSAVLVGGGIRGGRVIGATDADGVHIQHRPVTIPELFATLYAALGIDPAKANRTPQGPISLTEDGTPIKELLGA
jgi:uncharacterized protein (DUF1501 family)